MSANIYLRFVRSKRRMEELAEKYGRTHPEVLKQSQKVDRLVVQLQKRAG